ncbi:MAG: carbohydrate ABC transporter permease [Anaerolineae bacterium]|nr:carbohydrate ABC transporter permease [Anaerolineae bacterium]
MRRRTRIRQAIVMTLLTIVVIVLLFPFLWMFSTALKPPDEVFTPSPRWIPANPTLDNFTHILGSTAFPRYFANSVLVAFITMALSVLITIFAGYALSRYNFRGKGTFSLWLLVSQMFPPMLLIIPIFVLMLETGLYNTYASLIITYGTFALPFSTWMMRSYFDTVPPIWKRRRWWTGARACRRWRAWCCPSPRRGSRRWRCSSSSWRGRSTCSPSP